VKNVRKPQVAAGDFFDSHCMCNLETQCYSSRIITDWFNNTFNIPSLL